MTDIYTTDVVAPEKRASFWSQFADQFFDEEITFGADAQIELLNAEVMHNAVGPLDVFESTIPFKIRAHGRRSRSRDFLIQICLQRSGEGHLLHGGNEATMKPGDLVVMDGSQQYESENEPGNCVFITVPYRSNTGQLMRPMDVAGVRIDGRNGAGAVASNFVDAFARQAPHVSGNAANALARSLIDIVNSAALAELELCDRDARREKSFQYLTIRNFIEDNLHDPDLSPRGIAGRHGISRRYLSKLFEGRQMTVARLIQERRLVHSRFDLTNPANQGRTITQIAYRWGFNSTAHFSRAFKARFGITPRQARAATDH